MYNIQEEDGEEESEVKEDKNKINYAKFLGEEEEENFEEIARQVAKEQKQVLAESVNVVFFNIN